MFENKPTNETLANKTFFRFMIGFSGILLLAFASVFTIGFLGERQAGGEDEYTEEEV